MKNRKRLTFQTSALRLASALVSLLLSALTLGANASAQPIVPLQIRAAAGGPSSSNTPEQSSFSVSPLSILSYYGGRVVSNMQVVEVLWGMGGIGSSDGQFLAEVKNTSSPSMATFYQAILNSAYVDWLTEYNTDILDVGGSQGTNQMIGHGNFVGQYVITPSNTANPIDDNAIQIELANQIIGGNLPVPTTDANGNINTYYAIFFPHGMTITVGDYTSCGGAKPFCAYHSTIANVGGQEIYYGAHPDYQTGSGCHLICGSEPLTFESVTSTASHEMVETITDPEVGLATDFAPPLAWYTLSSLEIGDICVDPVTGISKDGSVVGSDGVTYLVQAEFSNTANDCIVTAGTATTSLTVKQPSNIFGTVTATGSKSATLMATNQGTVIANILAVSMGSSSSSSFKVGSDGCSGQKIKPKATCKVGVTFAPTLADGTETGSLIVHYNGQTVVNSMLGNSIAAALTAPKSATLKGAAPNGIGPAKTIKITNHSVVPITPGPAEPTLSAEFAIANDGCAGSILKHGKSCTVQVEAAPDGSTATGQVINGTLSYPFSYGPNGGNVSVALTSKVL